MCQVSEEEIILFAAGSLDRDEGDHVRGHLATGCPECAGRLAAAEATLGWVGLSAMDETTKVPEAAKAKLDRLITGEAEEQVGAGERSGLRISDHPSEPRRAAAWWPAAIAAVVAAGVSVGILYPKLTDERDRAAALQVENLTVRDDKSKLEERLAAANATVVALTSERNSAAVQLAAAEKAQRELEMMLHSTQLVTLDLKGTADDAGAKGMLLVDLKNGIWKFFATNLKPMPNRQFEFWLITADGTKVPMGHFATNALGEGDVGNKVPDPLPKLAMAAVSDEPVGSTPSQPSGSLHVTGEFH